jgi:predicted TIM-barrel fold metal-dependent hydrolase
MHVVDPAAFPLDPSAQYQPEPHLLQDALAFYASLGISNMVFVQPSIYGHDNSCMLEALKAVTPRHGRAVVTFDHSSIDQRQLRAWHELGVRGVRVNLVSVGRELTQEELRQELQRYAKSIRALGWVLELFVPMHLLPDVRDVVSDLGVKVCIDHFGWPTLPEPSSTEAVDSRSLPGLDALLEMLQKDVWVKLSAPYRLSKDPQMRDLRPLGSTLVQEAPDRVVYATDWPHTRFKDIDPVPFIEMCYDWCGPDDKIADKLFAKNAEHLWNVS